VPMCDDLAVEADSGGHTDNRPLVVILPMIIAVRDRVHREMGYPRHLRVRVGAGGGVGNPAAAAAAFQMGAAFVVTGTINQMARQSGSSDIVRGQLAKATYSDITMAPAADMFDQGVQLQVLKKGTMFAARAKKLYELFVRYDALDDIPAEERDRLERQVFRKPLDAVWAETVQYYVDVLKDAGKIEQAGRDPKLKMSLVFRWYLGLSSTWANAGVADRAMDYQVWCGPAIGAFNEFIRGSYLDPVVAKAYPSVDQINKELMRGACLLRRVALLRAKAARLGALDVLDAELVAYVPDGGV
jgi:trans-AT polyketide synthase/acyltransferase/oxidoreductase domain-containing protein